MKGNVWTVFATIIFLALVLTTVNIGYESATTTKTIQNETVTVDYDEHISVDLNATSYKDNEKAYNKTEDRLEEGTDYDWNTKTGNISFFNTSATEEGQNATITYTGFVRSQSTDNVASILGSIAPFLVFALILFAVCGTIIGWIFQL